MADRESRWSSSKKLVVVPNWVANGVPSSVSAVVGVSVGGGLQEFWVLLGFVGSGSLAKNVERVSWI